MVKRKTGHTEVARATQSQRPEGYRHSNVTWRCLRCANFSNVHSALLCAMLFLGLAHSQTAEATKDCQTLASLRLPDGEITRAQLVPAGQFADTPGGLLAPGARAARPFNLLPAFCRISAILKPSDDSAIGIEVWLPTEGWNKRFEGLGNGGWAGTISWNGLAGAVGQGYAASATDTGHLANAAGSPAGFALHHPEKLIDFGYRAVHEMTVTAKALIQAYYGKAPNQSYWNGCSTGGRQGLMEAQRYPADYDGIVAGAPANYMTHLMAHTIWVAQATLADEAGYVPPAKYAAIHEAVIKACDSLDGVQDGVLEDPRPCAFDPKTIQCQDVDGPGCLTAAQVAAVRKIYSPARNPRTGGQIYPGLEPGSELGWMGLAGGPAPLNLATSYYQNIVFEDPAWDFRTFDFDEGLARADGLDHGVLNATDPNLKPFFDRQGKLLMYHGWNDELIAPENSVDYYRNVEARLGGAGNVSGSMRLFMAPGVKHCSGGDGPSNFDGLSAMERWVEQKEAPTQIVASHVSNGVVDRTRPLCPYPQVAVYGGTGDPNSAASFSCKAPVGKSK